MKKILAALLVLVALSAAVPVLGDMMGVKPGSDNPGTSYAESAE